MNNESTHIGLYEDEVDRVLCTALDVGENLLKNGAAVHRAEDTIDRICRAFGAVHVEVFCIPSLIIVTIRMADGGYCTQNRRLYASSNNFYRLDKLNNVSRKLCSGNMTIEEAQQEIREIKNQKPYPAWLQHVGALLACGGFSAFFGGTLLDTVAAALIALVISLIKSRLPRSVNTLSYTLVCSLLAGIASILLFHVGFADNYDKVMIGTIMLLVPGLAFGTSIRDLLCGDTVAGLIQFIQSVLLAAIIAFGYTIAIYLLRPLIV